MKIYIILLLVGIALTSASESKPEWKFKTSEEWSYIHKRCDEAHIVSEELLEKAKNDKYPPKEVFEVVLCIFRGVRVWCDRRGFSTDRLMMGLERIANKENVSKEFLRESIESCNDDNSQGSTPLDWGYRVYKCFKDNENFFKVFRQINFVEEKVDKVEE